MSAEYLQLNAAADRLKKMDATCCQTPEVTPEPGKSLNTVKLYGFPDIVCPHEVSSRVRQLGDAFLLWLAHLDLEKWANGDDLPGLIKEHFSEAKNKFANFTLCRDGSSSLTDAATVFCYTKLDITSCAGRTYHSALIFHFNLPDEE